MNKLLIAGLAVAGVIANNWMSSRLIRNAEIARIPALIASYSKSIAETEDFDEAWKLLHFDRFLATAGMGYASHREEYTTALADAFRTEFNKRNK